MLVIMEHIITPDERIRRAEEIYLRRQSRKQTVRKINVESSERKNFKLVKRLILQSIICILIYFVFYLINTTNYTFSGAVLSKTREIMSYDFDFAGAYNNITASVNEYLYSNKENEEKDENNETSNEEIIDNSEVVENTGNNERGEG